MKLILIGLLLFFYSCNNNYKKEKIVTKQKNNIEQYAEELNIVASLDTIDNKIFSIDLFELTKKGNIVISNFDVIDITNKGDQNFVKIRSFESLINFYINIRVSIKQLNYLRKQIKADDIFNEKTFVIKVTDLKKMDFHLESKSDDEYLYVEIEPNSFGPYILEAELIKVIE
ncbi:hypothetical protein ABMY20_07260 [Tenacibaculum sp. SSH1-16]|uniref:hypothetical protein n=1 Tax=Tenacibaculum sp. SSH1-16 TaxID=3136667 RepID=UPI0032C3FC82